MRGVIQRRRLRRGVVLAAIVGVLASFALVGTSPAGAATGITWNTSVGTAAPPSTLGPYPMTSFGADPQPLGAGTTGVADPAGTIGFTPALFHATVPSGGWNNWSNGYTGSVYYDDTVAGSSPDTIKITLPSNTFAFYFYSEADTFTTTTVTATMQDGTTTGPISGVTTPNGATYFGVYTDGTVPLATITVTAPIRIAVGEFGIAKVGTGRLACANGLTPHLIVESTTSGLISGEYCVNLQGIGTYTQDGRIAPGRIIKVGNIIWFQAMGNNLRVSGYLNTANGASSFVQTKPISATGKVITFT